MTTPHPHDGQDGLRARVPADVDAPDKVLYGLTFRQLAILAAAAFAAYLGWRALHHLVPAAVLLTVGAVAGGLVFAVAVGRRDGLPLDRWLLAAVVHQRTPRRLSTTDTRTAIPAWVQPPQTRVPLPAPLALPADAIADDGRISLAPGGTVAVTAVSSVNLALRTPGEQAALIDGFGRWLNSLSTPTQIVVSAQPVDLHTAARTLAHRSDQLPHPALRAACADHAAFLQHLAARRDPLRRQVLIVTGAAAGADHQALRGADDTVRALSGLGAAGRVLDGSAATAAIAACADPYRPPGPGGLAAPDTAITAAPLGAAPHEEQP